MKTVSIMMTALLAAAMAQAGDNAYHAERVVTLCVEGGAGFGVQVRAEAIAAKMFGEIGITLVWQQGFRHCPEQGLHLHLTDETPPGLLPDALAYALPYEGAHIRVFYDRVVKDRPAVLVPTLLAHVMVHEITHMLEGICEHSQEGVMKAHWNQADFGLMLYKPLPFTEADIDRIDRALATRASSLLKGKALRASL